MRPDAIRFGSSVDPTSENWVVFVDHEHCVDDGTLEPQVTEDLYMLLEPDTVVFVIARDFL